MKEIKSKHINSIILSILLCMPFLSILARCCYTAINKNSSLPVQSQTAIVEKHLQSNEVQSNDDLIDGNVYTYNFENALTLEGYMYPQYFSVYKFYYADTIFDGDNLVVAADYLRVESGTDYENEIELPSDDYFVVYKSDVSNDVDYHAFSLCDVDVFDYETETRQVFDNSNAFDYSIYQFVKDNNLGNVDLVSWFTGMFLNNTGESALYVNFINWYLNYAMLVTLVHFLFLVLMWFICYCRKLLERGMNYDW